MVRTVLTAVPADLTTQRTAPAQVVAMLQPAAVRAVRLEAEEHVVPLGLLLHMVPQVQQDLTVRLGPMVRLSLWVQQGLTAHLLHRVVDHLAVLLVVAQPVVLHEWPVDLMAPQAPLLLLGQPVLTDLIRQVGLTAGNFCCGVANDTVKWKLEIRKRQWVTSNSG